MKQEGDVILSARRTRERLTRSKKKKPNNHFISWTLDPALEVTDRKRHPAVPQRHEEVMSPCWLQWLPFPTGLWSEKDSTALVYRRRDRKDFVWLNVNPQWNRKMDYRRKCCSERESFLCCLFHLIRSSPGLWTKSHSFICSCFINQFYCWDHTSGMIPPHHEKTKITFSMPGLSLSL